jgi:hypothetical protein
LSSVSAKHTYISTKSILLHIAAAICFEQAKHLDIYEWFHVWLSRCLSQWSPKSCHDSKKSELTHQCSNQHRHYFPQKHQCPWSWEWSNLCRVWNRHSIYHLWWMNCATPPSQKKKTKVNICHQSFESFTIFLNCNVIMSLTTKCSSCIDKFTNINTYWTSFLINCYSEKIQIGPTKSF